MKKNKKNKLQKDKKIKNPKIFKKIGKGILAILCVISSILALAAIKQPLIKEVRSTINTIDEKHSFDYTIRVKKSELYPDGGIVKPDNVIFTNLTDLLIIQLKSTVSSQQPVRIDAISEVKYRLVAKDMWEREFELIPEKSHTIEGENLSILDEIQINFDEIFTLINTIEEETLVRPNGYQIVIQPLVKGSVLNQEGQVIYNIENVLSIPFEITSQYIRYAGETPEKELTNTNKIENQEVIPQSFILFGNQLDIKLARLVFSTIAILAFVFLAKPVLIRTYKKKSKISEVDIIDRKFKNRIIEVSDKISFNMLPQLGLKKLKVLIQIADEKEEPVLKYSDGNMVYYYVLGSASVYYYGIEKNCG